MKTTTIATQDQRLVAGAGRPDRVGGVGEGQLAHRVEADGQRQDR